MSFAAKTKKELTMIEVDQCCMRAELSALAQMNGTLQLGKPLVLEIATENAAIARRIYILLKELYGITSELLVRKKMRLKKNNVYLVRVKEQTRQILEELGIWKDGPVVHHQIDPTVIEKDCCKRAYLRGAFLAGGSVNHPESTSYHLEIFSSYEDHCHSLTNLTNSFFLNAKEIERKKGHVMYMKEGEKIADFLRLIGASQAVLNFEDVRILKDMRNSVNRLVNCETANLNKTVSAAIRQVESIKYIDATIGLETLPPKLLEVARVRLEHPDLNLNELGELLPNGKVSKSGVNHRLRKIEEIAKNLMEHPENQG
ncbi:DNA-binding protein WhiA [Rubeoparvulum massiliense]|uniref:DNA-binding protein WhiA n=1 Tax=Rubeoparvulum massiliense TaxID=1631346 RepID=UPI00065E79D9|nr:DNA-binding protein WhiA [Rubeoparvulum massiliense]